MGLALALGPLYWLVLAPPSSVQAFVDTDIIVIRAPVAGKLTLHPDLQGGGMVAAAQDLGQLAGDVENPQVVSLKLQHEQKRSRIAVLEEQITGIERRLADRAHLIEQFGRENREEQRLRQVFLAAQLKGAREELRRVLARASVVDASERRIRSLSARGVVSQANLDDVIGSGRAAEAEVDAQKARVIQLEAALEASALGLDLDGTRSLGQTATRLRELRSDVVDLEQQQHELRRSLEAERAEFAVIDTELYRQRKVELLAPRSAVVWSIDARPGETVASNTPLLQLADCGRVRVEDFFDEADAAALAVGQPVKVRLTHGEKVWDGTVETIRAGTGRVTVGDNVVLPPPEIARRQLPVRVITLRVKVDWAEGDLQPEQFCLAGRSAEVFIE
ncbi:MAG TPA: HlyD family efflux transporter periplasmic adaptor subunit [Arenibaculum sp.]|nr:HlyD family efflux transporter periplasmic adaptor subunit [Arenibaculum sp.]